MPNSIRILLDEGASPSSLDSGVGGARLVTDVRVRLRSFGAGQTNAQRDSARPAKLEFLARFLSSARKPADGAALSLAELSGEVVREGSPPRVVFRCDPASLSNLSDAFVQTVEATQQDAPPPRLSLALSLASPDFSGAEALEAPLRLVLPANPERHPHLEVLAELSVAGSLEAPRDKNDILDVPLRLSTAFPLAEQKKATLMDIGPEPGPILLASNDPSFLPGAGSLKDKVRDQNAKRDKDSSPATQPGGDFIPFQLVGKARRPLFKLDHGFLDDGNGNLDESKRESPTAVDFASKAKWILILNGAETLRPDLFDATRAYRHFLGAAGTDQTFSYERFAKSDRTGAQIVEAAIEDVRAAAIELDDPRGGNRFVIQSDAIPVGATDENGDLLNPRYGYPGTENWQKAIGAHVVWLEGAVTTGALNGQRTFVIELTLHAEDRYNFNPGAADIATGVADAENGRFEITGLGKEFLNRSTLKRTIRFSLSSGPVDFRRKPDNQVVSGPNRN